jgi:hypothetical protein
MSADFMFDVMLSVGCPHPQPLPQFGGGEYLGKNQLTFGGRFAIFFLGGGDNLQRYMVASPE